MINNQIDFMYSLSNNVNSLIMGASSFYEDDLLSIVEDNDRIGEVKLVSESLNFAVELFAGQFNMFFVAEELSQDIDKYKDQISDLNVVVFVVCNESDAEDEKNIFYIEKNNISKSYLNTLINISSAYCDKSKEDSKLDILENIDEFIYVKKIPFESRNISYFSGRVKDILGYEPSDRSLLLNVDKIIHPDDLSAFFIVNEEDVLDRLIKPHRIRLKKNNSNSYLWIERKAIPQYLEGKLHSVVFLCKDVSSEITYRETLHYNNHYDSLTGLANKSLFTQNIQDIYNSSARKNFVLFCLSLDRFKNINDALGHDIGDYVIIDVSKRIKNVVKREDLVARFTGDEFLICVSNVEYLHDATFLADTLFDTVCQPYCAKQSEIYLSCSIGIAMNNHYYDNAETIISDAYHAMHKAKSDVLTHYAVYEHDKQNLSGLACMNLESDLRRAIKKEEFFLEYQPIVSLKDYSVSTIEALLRWQHPQKGLLAPDDFIPLAEKTGLIVELGDWVINESIYAINSLLNSPEKTSIKNISINISPMQLGQMDLCERIDQLMVEHQLPSQSIKFELTESVVMNEENSVNGILSQFKSMGIQLSMDDFGTGYSSLSYLNHLPFNYVKIDKSFIADLYGKGSGKDFVHTIIQLAHNMNMQVVAEGVETAEQALILRNLGCEYAQGFYFSRSVSLENLPSCLSKISTNSKIKQQLS